MKRRCREPVQLLGVGDHCARSRKLFTWYMYRDKLRWASTNPKTTHTENKNRTVLFEKAKMLSWELCHFSRSKTGAPTDTNASTNSKTTHTEN